MLVSRVIILIDICSLSQRIKTVMVRTAVPPGWPPTGPGYFTHALGGTCVTSTFQQSYVLTQGHTAGKFWT